LVKQCTPDGVGDFSPESVVKINILVVATLNDADSQRVDKCSEGTPLGGQQLFSENPRFLFHRSSAE
jgi:hypothetical protein